VGPKGWGGVGWSAVRQAIRRPTGTILVLVALTLAAGAGLWRLELRMDGHALVPPRDPTVLFDQEVREHFGIRDPLILLVETRHPQGIFNPATLRRVQHISDRVTGLEEIGSEHVMSLATERRDRVYPGTLTFRPFLDPFPDTPWLMEHLRTDIEAAGILTGTLVSEDRHAAAIFVGVPGSDSEGFDRAAFYHRLVRELEPFQSDMDRVLVVGAPAAEALLGEHLLEDLAVLMPLAIGLMALLLGWRLGRVWGVILGLAEVGACLVFTFGLMGWLGFPIYLTTAVLPVVLITIGLADEIHVFYHYQRHLALRPEGGPRTAVVERTMREMLPPVLLTSITTSIGFLSFVLSSIEPIRSFGIFAAVGILFCLLWTLTVIPAALSRIPTERMAPRRARTGSRVWTARALSPLVRTPRWTLTVLAGVTLALGWGLHFLYIQDSWIDGFAPDSTFRQHTERVNEKLFGTHTLLIHLRTAGGEGEVPRGDGRQGWLLDPALLNEIGDLEEYLRARPAVGGVLGPYGHLSTVAHLWLGRKNGTRRIPDQPERVARVLRFFDVVRGSHRRREVVDDSLRRALVAVFLEDANYLETRQLIRGIRDYEERFDSQQVRLSLAGDVAVSQAMIPAIARSQVLSLLLALIGALVTLCLVFRSLRLGLLALLPVSVSVLWTFGAMGWSDIPLGVATSMFCAISLGVGVDYAIHFIASHRRAREAGFAQPVEQALSETGPAIVTDMLVIAGSFGLLLVSQVPANARLGLLVAFALGAACCLTLVGLGAWMSWKPPRALAETRTFE